VSLRRRASALLFVLAQCASVVQAADVGCARYADDTIVTGRVPAVLPELSGLAASRRHPGIYWGHNDSGHELRLHAIRDTGALVATFTILGATASDPEDVAVGPCMPGDARTCIFLADTGNNLRARTDVKLLRVVEPEQLRSGPLVADAVTFRYPSGAHDAETLLVDPRSGELFVVTKSLLSLGDAYRVPWTRKPGLRATHVAALRIPDGWDLLATAGSVHPSGTRVLLRTYRGVWEYRQPGARSLADVLRATPRAVPAGHQLQGEAITYTADGRGYLLGAEGGSSSLERVDCADAPAGAPPQRGKSES